MGKSVLGKVLPCFHTNCASPYPLWSFTTEMRKQGSRACRLGTFQTSTITRMVQQHLTEAVPSTLLALFNAISHYSHAYLVHYQGFVDG